MGAENQGATVQDFVDMFKVEMESNHYGELVTKEQSRGSYLSQVVNSLSNTIYRNFDGELSEIEKWCKEYVHDLESRGQIGVNTLKVPVFYGAAIQAYTKHVRG